MSIADSLNATKSVDIKAAGSTYSSPEAFVGATPGVAIGSAMVVAALKGHQMAQADD